MALAILLLVAYALFRGVMGLAGLPAMYGPSEPDPMFAEPAEQFTRPPELLEDEASAVSGDDDPSLNWVYETLTPVEKTAAELAGES